MRLTDSMDGLAIRAVTSVSGEAGDGTSTTPELREMVTEATRALAQLDVARLEELALSCQALTRMRLPKLIEEQNEFGRQARAARGEMAVFARVLEATRANLKVMERLRELRLGKAGYAGNAATSARIVLKSVEGGHGND